MPVGVDLDLDQVTGPNSITAIFVAAVNFAHLGADNLAKIRLAQMAKSFEQEVFETVAVKGLRDLNFDACVHG